MEFLWGVEQLIRCWQRLAVWNINLLFHQTKLRQLQISQIPKFESIRHNTNLFVVNAEIDVYRPQIKFYFNYNRIVRKIENMEYKYRMLNPIPYSTQSIDFKLSETYLENYNIRSPLKGQDSLTYTVSMETINDFDHSPKKHYYHQYLQIPENFVSVQNINSNEEPKNTGPYELSSQQPIVSIRIEKQESQIRINAEKLQQVELKQAAKIELCKQNFNTHRSVFSKKFALKVQNIGLESIPEQNGNQNQLKMGKVMSRIHSQIKEGRTIYKSRTLSQKQKGQSVSIDKKNRAESAKKVQITDYKTCDQIQERKHLKSSLIQESKNCEAFSQIKCNGSILTKTNCSSNANCSPELSRRKSDYTFQKEEPGHIKKKSIFLSERSAERMKIYKNFKSINPQSITMRQKIYSTLVSGKAFENKLVKAQSQSEKYSTVINENRRQKSVMQKSVQKHNKKMIEKNANSDRDLTKSISIVALKMNEMQKQHNDGLILSNSKRRLEVEKHGKENKKDLINEIEISTDAVMGNLHHKKGWRKVKQHVFKKQFCI